MPIDHFETMRGMKAWRDRRPFKLMWREIRDTRGWWICHAARYAPKKWWVTVDGRTIGRFASEKDARLIARWRTECR